MVDISPTTGPVPPPSVIGRHALLLGRAFLDSIVAGDFDRLETLLAPDVRFRALIPRACQEAATAAGARELVEGWFGESDQRELLGSTVDLVGDRLVVGYLIGLTEAGERRIVAQHLAAAVHDGRLRDVSLVCSGFRPLAGDPDRALGGLGGDASPGDDRRAEASDVHGGVSPGFAPGARLDATGLTCATLTPTIRSAVLGLDPGALLEIVTDDPDAEEGLRSWTRLTGHELVAAEAGPGPARRFHIRRSLRRAAPAEHGGTN